MLKIKMQDGYKSIFTIDEVNALNEMKRDGYKESINENGIQLDDFTNAPADHVLKISLEFCKHDGAEMFFDERLKNIDILVNVLIYDGITFRDSQYYWSDFIRATPDNFTQYTKTFKEV